MLLDKYQKQIKLLYEQKGHSVICLDVAISKFCLQCMQRKGKRLGAESC